MSERVDVFGDGRAVLWQGDCLEVMHSMPDESADLVFGSPPYEVARTYGIDFDLRGQAWVDWMVECWREMRRVSRGVVAMVVEGQTRDFSWSATPALLMADLKRAGFFLRKPPAFQRNGIPGSGGPDWLRNDYEFVVCTSKGRLPWSDNTACGHPPKWGPGGAMSNRLSNGARVNQWGGSAGKTRFGKKKDGSIDTNPRPSHRLERGNPKGSACSVPAIANPGNVINCGSVGGGRMGDPLAHESEAPFPETLAEFFVRSFCPPDGVALDPFLGSGTTAAVALKWGRRAMGIDIRQSQIDLTLRRLRKVADDAPLFVGADEETT